MTTRTTTAQWAKQIHTAWRSSLRGIIRSGQLLVAAKAKLAHGQFKWMIENELPFSPSTAQRLMTIARNPQLTNPAHARHLPPSWYSLCQLARLPKKEFDAALAAGAIRPDMERDDIDELVPRTRVYVPVTRGEPPAQPPKMIRFVIHEEPPARSSIQYKSMTASDETTPATASETAPATQADRVLERLELLLAPIDELLADKADEVAELLRTRGEDFVPVMRALRTLADFAAQCGAVGYHEENEQARKLL